MEVRTPRALWWGGGGVFAGLLPPFSQGWREGCCCVPPPRFWRCWPKPPFRAGVPPALWWAQGGSGQPCCVNLYFLQVAAEQRRRGVASVEVGAAAAGGSGEGDGGERGEVQRRLRGGGGPAVGAGSGAAVVAVLELDAELADAGLGEDVGDPLDDEGGGLLLRGGGVSWGGRDTERGLAVQGRAKVCLALGVGVLCGGFSGSEEGVLPSVERVSVCGGLCFPRPPPVCWGPLSSAEPISSV